MRLGYSELNKHVGYKNVWSLKAMERSVWLSQKLVLTAGIYTSQKLALLILMETNIVHEKSGLLLDWRELWWGKLDKVMGASNTGR